jgi:predicted nucleic acid-binding protein
LREGIPSQIVTAFLGDLLNRATPISIRLNLRPLALDPDDDIFAELCLAAGAEYLVTFNDQDFWPIRRYGIAVVTPAQFLNITGGL